MSRLYFHSEHGEAELSGAERHWLRRIAERPAQIIYQEQLDDTDRVADFLGLVDWDRDPQRENRYLQTSLRDARAEQVRNDELWATRRPGDPVASVVNATSHDEGRRLRSSLHAVLRTRGLPITVAGVKMHTANIELNTALVAGSDPVRLAAKLSGWSEQHCWVDGPDRAWMADVIDEGLRTGIYRRGQWYVDRPCRGLPEDQPDRQWADQGWDQVLELLRSRDDGPVVLSYSVTDRFPNAFIGGWRPAPIPEDWTPHWASSPERLAEWERDYPTRADRQEYYTVHVAGDAWYKLPADQQWRLAMAGLREQRPWARLAADTLTEFTFHLPFTFYDLFSPDRDERARAAEARCGAAEDPEPDT